MNKRILLLVNVLGVIVISGLVLSNRSGKSGDPVSPPGSENQPVFEPITSNEGSVEVAVTPINMSPESRNWSFEVILNTHSAELSEDMTSVSKLIFDTGETTAPLSWEGNPPGGHHRSGILTFDVLTFSKPSPATSKVTLKILKIGGVPERKFQWSLK